MNYYVFIFWIVLFIGLMIEIKGDINSLALTPKAIKDSSDLNIIGSTIIFLLMFIGCPLMIIFKFLYWVTHIKFNKKNKKEVNK